LPNAIFLGVLAGYPLGYDVKITTPTVPLLYELPGIYAYIPAYIGGVGSGAVFHIPLRSLYGWLSKAYGSDTDSPAKLSLDPSA